MNGDCADDDVEVIQELLRKKDGLLSQDHGELSERVSCLEKKVSQQEDEIVCLRSALADVIRRLGQAEAGRAQNSVLPSRPTLRSARRSGSDRKSNMSPLDNANVTPNRSSTPPISRSSASPRSAHTPGKKWSSSSADLHSSQSGAVRRSTSHTSLTQRTAQKGVKEAEWNSVFEEGYMRLYIRGRAVNLYAPSSLGEMNLSTIAEAPDEKLKLEWVYGYRGRDCRSNLYHLPTGEAIYIAAATIVLQNFDENTQRHYLGHTDDVKCLAIHPDKVRVASGQVAGHDKREGKPHVRIWDSVSLNTLHVVGIGDFDRAVCCISFSKLDGGNHMVVVDEANEHVMSIWDLSKSSPKKITETKSSTEPVLAAEFHPSEKGNIVSCGKSQISFWTFEGGTLAKKAGIFEKHDKPKFVVCLAFAENGDVISGDSNGSICIWPKGTNRISQAIEGAHDGGVFSLCIMKDGTLLSGGGKDRKIIQWDKSYTKSGVETEIPESFGGIRMLSQGNGGLVLVGTTRNCVLRGTVDLQMDPVIQGHMDELWGLASHPTQHQFMTAGSDKQVHLWDGMAHSVVWSKEITDPAHCCSFHPNGNVAAVGTETGRWLVLDLGTHEVLTSHTDGKEQIECCQYSPDGKYLALGSRDNYIYLYEVADEGVKYSRVGRCSGHSSFITHIDWSADNATLMSNSGDYEVLYWKVPSCNQETNTSSLRDAEWATGNCTFTFNAAGIWPEGADGTDVNNCARSNKFKLIASADDFGKVNLYKYPCCQPKSNRHIYGGHSSHVTSVSFLYDDSRLLSTGGRDMSIMQWEIV